MSQPIKRPRGVTPRGLGGITHRPSHPSLGTVAEEGVIPSPSVKYSTLPGVGQLEFSFAAYQMQQRAGHLFLWSQGGGRTA